jgi:hypothetical protein
MRGRIAALMLGAGAVLVVPPSSLAAGTAPAALAQEQPITRRDFPVVTAQGSALVSRSPDRAVLVFGCSTQAETSAKAQNDLNASMERVLKAVKALNLPGLVVQTSGLSLSPMFDFSTQTDGRPPRITGYRASNTVRAQVDDVSKVGTIIDAAIAAGANELQGISFELKDDKEARREALTKAAQDAREEAETLAAALGLRIEGVVEAQVGTPVMRPFFARSMAMEMQAAAAPTPVEPGEVQVQAEATVIFRAAPRP